MRKIIMAFTAFFVLCFPLHHVWASVEQDVQSKIIEVNVFQNYAKIKRSARVNLPKGQGFLVFKELSNKILENSIQVNIQEPAKLMSVNYRMDYMKDKKRSSLIQALMDSLEMHDYDFNLLNSEKSVLLAEDEMIRKNNSLMNENSGFQVSQLKELADLFRSRLMEIRKKLLDIDHKIKKTDKERQRIRRQLNELNAIQETPFGEILVEYSNTGTFSGEIEFSYVVTGAGWTPLYDMRSEGIDKAVVLTYKAHIYQNTGIAWNDVKLIISTSNPSLNNSRPIMHPFFIDFVDPNAYLRAKEPVQMMENIMVMDTRRDGSFADADEETKREEASGGSFSEKQLNVEFEVPLKHNIPADGKYHLVAMKNFELAANYEYHTVPKMDQGAFLLAKIGDWGKYNLLPGNANIFFEGAYTGQSYINPYTTADTLLLSLGRDEKIKIKRLQLQDMTSNQVIGSNRKVTLAYETIIRNTKNQALVIEVLDQIPISKNKDIEVKLLEYDGAEYNPDYGRLLWKIQINPNETKKIRLVYYIKYPKDRNINILL
jgi:uncharacterized protein (TIGR02231 family)